ncbi:hypothetical protein G7Z17_g5121 [Cylindrodendrum hubeiense]|uniref:Uncharacterized protein n=1 Tax=Cylindrodendrum hubeiense TaxID=595255 RepID=A0A9P5HFH7_9HYPO|nr:hypothetical protein G7Z17_g5121 [Cylindrodendrum hubeiense]
MSDTDPRVLLAGVFEQMEARIEAQMIARIEARAKQQDALFAQAEESQRQIEARLTELTKEVAKLKELLPHADPVVPTTEQTPSVDRRPILTPKPAIGKIQKRTFQSSQGELDMAAQRPKKHDMYSPIKWWRVDPTEKKL